MSNFSNAITNVTSTENGALTFSSTRSKVLDLFSMGGAMRERPEEDIVSLVTEAWNEDPLRTLEVLLYLRDIRKGQGEKRVFKVGISAIRKHFHLDELVKALVEIGSWKDVFTILQVGEYAPVIKPIILKHIETGKYDLMEKYLPSVGGSRNKEAEALARYLEMPIKAYRKYLSTARAKINIVESHMCAKNWGSIDYSKVPSKANLLYSSAFRRNDTERYNQFLSDVISGKNNTTMHAGTLAPYEIVGKYLDKMCIYFGESKLKETYDPALEAMWKSLPTFGENSNALIVADTSGSMYGRPMEIAFSLAIYFAERTKGLFHNEFITFSSSPSLFKFEDGQSLMERVYSMYSNCIIENTDLYKTFELVLRTAKLNDLPKEDMPKSIYVISDMEFDAAGGDSYTTNFKAIKNLYEQSGYDMPTLVFWNVNSHQSNVPVTLSEDGVVLVSGSSSTTFDMVISQDINPYKFMLSVIDSERYQSFAKAIIGDED